MQLRKKYKIISTSLFSTISIIILHNYGTDFCPTIGTLQDDFYSYLIAFLIWLIGYYLFKKLNLDPNRIILYFTFLTILSLNHLFVKIITSQNDKNKPIIESICKKSKDDGMLSNYSTLTNEEYCFLIKTGSVLPEIPINTEKIDIEYYRDNFLGDFHLKINIELPEGSTINHTKFPEWEKWIFLEYEIQKNIYYYERSAS